MDGNRKFWPKELFASLRREARGEAPVDPDKSGIHDRGELLARAKEAAGVKEDVELSAPIASEGPMSPEDHAAYLSGEETLSSPVVSEGPLSPEDAARMAEVRDSIDDIDLEDDEDTTTWDDGADLDDDDEPTQS